MRPSSTKQHFVHAMLAKATRLANSCSRRMTPLDSAHSAGRAALDALVTQQAQVIAYIDDYKLLLIATLALFALLAIFKKSNTLASHAAAVEG